MIDNSIQEPLSPPKPINRFDLFLPIRKAQEMGASEEQILTAIATKRPEYAEKFQEAIDKGATSQQIFKALNRKPDFTENKIRATARTGTQYGIGLAELSTLPYNLTAIGAKAIIDSADSSGQGLLTREIERLSNKKSLGLLTEDEEKKLAHYKKVVPNLPEFPALDVGSLIEKSFEQFGIDMTPENFREEAARMTGLFKNPKKIIPVLKEFYKDPKKAAQVAKAITPTISEATRAFGATTGLEIAREGGFGFLGTMAAMILGDASASLALKTAKTAGKVAQKVASSPREAIKSTKEATAKAVAIATRNSRKDVADSVALSMKESGIEADIGSLTNSNMVKTIQSFLESSGLLGEELDQLRKRITDEFASEYESIAKTLGEFKYKTIEEAADTIVDASEAIRFKLPSKEKLIPGKHRPLKGRIDVKPLKEYETKFLNEISSLEFTSDLEAGKELKEVANAIREPKKVAFKKKYGLIKKKTEDIKSSHGHLAKNLRSFLKNNSGSLIGKHVPEEQKLLTIVADLLKELEVEVKDVPGIVQSKAAQEKFGVLPQHVMDQINNQLKKTSKAKPISKYKELPLNNLWNSKTSLAALSDFDSGIAGFRSKYKAVVKLIDKEIERVIKSKAPDLFEKWKKTQAEYSKYKDIFENKRVLSFFEKNNKNYVSNYKSMLQEDSMAAIGEILNENLFSTLTLNKLKRDFAKNVLSKKDLQVRDFRNLEATIGRKGLIQGLEKDLEEFKKGLQPKKVETPVPRSLKPSDRPKTLEKIKFKGSRAEKDYLNKLADFINQRDPEQIFKMMDTVSGIKKLEKATSGFKIGEDLLDNLKRIKMQKMIGDNMIDSSTGLLKTGTFSKLLEKGDNRKIAKHILGTESYQKLLNIQNHASTLAASAQKFYNSSKTASSGRDFRTMVGTALTLTTGVMTGNVPLTLKVGLTAAAVKKIPALFSNKEFISMVSDAIIAEQTNNTKLLKSSWNGILKLLDENIGNLKQSGKAATATIIK